MKIIHNPGKDTEMNDAQKLPSRLIAAIDAKLADLGNEDGTGPLSDHGAENRFGLGRDGIRNIRRGHVPRGDKIQKLARFLEIDPIQVIDLVSDKKNSTQDINNAKTKSHDRKILVRGTVQAGVLVPAFEDNDKFEEIFIPSIPGQETWTKYALRVRGDSMNKFYPDGSIVIAAPFFDVGRAPRPADHVICLRREITDEYEATIKELQIGPDGQLILWPRSTNPEHQAPLHIPMRPEIAAWGDLHHAGESDVIFAGLVVQSIIPAHYFASK